MTLVAAPTNDSNANSSTDLDLETFYVVMQVVLQTLTLKHFMW